MKPDLIRHMEGENLGRFPVWMMRQAGRYLEAYRAVRAKHSFWEMVTTPKLAAEVSLQPLDVIPVDGIIFFSDILTLPHGLGLPISMVESVGPVVEKPLRAPEDFGVFSQFDALKHTGYVAEALSMISHAKPQEKALLGFAGAPWTVGTYLIEGRSSRHFEHIKKWLHSDPKSLTESLESLGKATLSYLQMQVKSGAQMVQLFDTWIAQMPASFFRQSYLPMLNRIFEPLEKAGIKTIYYTKGAHHLVPDFTGLSCSVLSVDDVLDLRDFEKRTEKKFSLQGNLDPVLLLTGTEGQVRLATRQIVQGARELSKPAIMNLGHGILPGTPVANAKAFIEEARQLWV